MVKECCTCKKEKVLEDFSKYSRSEDGRQPRCKECAKKYMSNRDNVYRTHFNVPSICVYAFKEGKEIAYIGSTKNGPYRLYEHLKCKGTGSMRFNPELNTLQIGMKYTWHILWHGDSFEDAKHQEKALIQIHNPRFNKIKYKNYAA